MNKTKNILYAVFFLYSIAAVTVLCISSQNLVWDPSLTVKMTDNGYKNIPFNYYQHPKPGNLAEDETEFISWWSPGQFAMPLLIEKCCAVNLNFALKILTLICLLFSSLGIYRLYHHLIANKTGRVEDGPGISVIALAMLLFTLIQPFFWGNLFEYDGGGILMLAYCPWFIYWVIKIDHINIYNLLLLLILGFIGFILKTSFTCIFIGALLYLFLSSIISVTRSSKGWDFKKMFLTGICLGIIFISYLIAIKIFFLDHNRNISDSSLGISVQPRVLVFPITAPIYGLFSLSVLNKTVYWLIGSVFIIPIYYFILKSNTISLLYKYVLVSFVGSCIFFYSLVYFINVDVSYELRHYTIITILITPAFFMAFWRGRLIKYFLAGLMLFYTALNLEGYAKHIISAAGNKRAAGYYSGLASPYSLDLVNKIHSLDNLNNKGKDIFYFTSSNPSVALEIRNNRVLLEDNFLNFHFNNSARFNPILYYGLNAGNIYLIYPQARFKSDSALYLTRFEKYKKFKKIYQTGDYAIFMAIAIGAPK